MPPLRTEVPGPSPRRGTSVETIPIDVEISHSDSGNFSQTISLVATDATGRSEERTFHVTLLEERSRWFKDQLKDPACLNCGKKYLKPFDLATFDAFFRCVQNLGTVGAPREGPFNALMDRLVIGRFMDSDKFVEETLRLLVQAVKDLGRIPRAEFMQSVYAETHRGASLRRLMIDMIVWEEVPEYMQLVTEPEELRSDVIAASMARNCGRSMEERPWKKAEKYLPMPRKARVEIKKEGGGKRKRAVAVEEGIGGGRNVVSVVFGTALMDLTGQD